MNIESLHVNSLKMNCLLFFFRFRRRYRMSAETATKLLEEVEPELGNKLCFGKNLVILKAKMAVEKCGHMCYSITVFYLLQATWRV